MDGRLSKSLLILLFFLVCCGCLDCGSGNKGDNVVNGRAAENGADEVAIYVAVVFHLFICEIT